MTTAHALHRRASDSWRDWLVRGAIAAVAVAFLLGVVYATIRIRQIYFLQAEIIHLQAEVETLAQADAAMKREATTRFDNLERTLFGDVLGKLSTPTTSKPEPIQLWQVNRDRELRDRLRVLEQWRITVDRQLQAVEKR